jgi:hypothetical protein
VKGLCQWERGLKKKTESFVFLKRVLLTFCKRERHFPLDAVKMPRPDQRGLHYSRQNPIQLSKNDTYEILERTKLLD